MQCYTISDVFHTEILSVHATNTLLHVCHTHFYNSSFVLLIIVRSFDSENVYRYAMNN